MSQHAYSYNHVSKHGRHGLLTRSPQTRNGQKCPYPIFQITPTFSPVIWKLLHSPHLKHFYVVLYCWNRSLPPRFFPRLTTSSPAMSKVIPNLNIHTHNDFPENVLPPIEKTRLQPPLPSSVIPQNEPTQSPPLDVIMSACHAPPASLSI